jgi:hypothetical protein
MRPYPEKVHYKKDGVAQGEGPEFKPQYPKTTKQNKIKQQKEKTVNGK